MKFILATVLLVFCIQPAGFTQTTPIKKVPQKYWTGINIFLTQKGKLPNIQDTVSIGEIGEDYLTLHGRRHNLINVEYEDNANYELISLATKPDSEGGWTVDIFQLKENGVLKNPWYYLTIQYHHRDLSKDNDASTYNLMIGPARINRNTSNFQR